MPLFPTHGATASRPLPAANGVANDLSLPVFGGDTGSSALHCAADPAIPLRFFTRRSRWS